MDMDKAALHKELNQKIEETKLFEPDFKNTSVSEWKLIGTNFYLNSYDEYIAFERGRSGFISLSKRWVKKMPLPDELRTSKRFQVTFVTFEEVFENINPELQGELLFYLDLFR